MPAGFRADAPACRGRTTDRGRLSKKKLIPDAGQDGLLQDRVSSPWDPARGRGEGTDVFPGSFHGKVFFEARSAGRLTVRFHQIFHFLSTLPLPQVTAGRSRVDL